MRKDSGFTLIELIIAVSLASFVLVGVITIAATMARNQINGIRSGTVTGWSLVSYLSMAKEIEDSNVLAYPINEGDQADSLIVCRNWSRAQGTLPGGMLDTSPGAVATVTQYCVDLTAPVAPETGYTLRRFSYNGNCPYPGVPATCSATPGAPWSANVSVVGFRLEKLGGLNVFMRANSIGGVRLRYVIGRQTPTTNDPVPKSTPFNIAIAMQKQYSSTLD